MTTDKVRILECVFRDCPPPEMVGVETTEEQTKRIHREQALIQGLARIEVEETYSEQLREFLALL